MAKKDQDKIASTKLARAGKLMNAGAKVGVNYMKYYAKSLSNKSAAKDQLEEDNAQDIYNAFSELKGGPLKLAQMLSMGDQLLPKAYTQQFAQAQNKVTPLSYPLIRKTFFKAVGKFPEEVFDTFSNEAVNAASIGQVHKGTIGDKTYAIKLQYPGVADSLLSDIKLITPVATRVLGFSKDEIGPYLDEVQSKLLEETDYKLELESSLKITEACKDLPGIVFPTFEKKLSGKRVLTMSWIDGLSLSDWMKTNPMQAQRNQIGQCLWDFYHYQIHVVRIMHADPHPGNFLITDDGKLGVIDFGCVKEIPTDFYESYIKLIQYGELRDHPEFISALVELDLYDPKDEKKKRELLLNTFSQMFGLVGKPMFKEQFDFGDDSFFKTIYEQGEALSRNSELRGMSARGSNHFIYFNRTYFGLYQLLNQIKAVVNTGDYIKNMLTYKKSA
jgi:predicted unusual protein kinase regulating ubiquinone biosynthesis (AarF/ABC1/UbiB family)